MIERSIGKVISILYRQSQIYMNYVLKDLNLNSSEYIFIMTLFNNEGINQEELSSLLLIDKAATARAIKSLESKKMVKREKDIFDKRSNKIYTTEIGKLKKEKIKKALKGWTQVLTEGMDEKTIATVFSALTSMTEKVRRINYQEMAQNKDINDKRIEA